MQESKQPEALRQLEALPLLLVAQHCHQESIRYGRDAAQDTRYCFELFRRAIVEGNDRAWECVYVQYMERTSIVRQWAEHHPLFSACDEDAAYFANRAFEKLWFALDAEKFAKFPDLASLLRYLKLCMNSVITDHVRAARQKELSLLDADLPQEDDPDLGHLQRRELWEMIEDRLRNPEERTVMYCRFDVGMKPSEIQREYPQLFRDVKDVYRILQNVLDRLRRDQTFLAYFEDRT